MVGLRAIRIFNNGCFKCWLDPFVALSRRHVTHDTTNTRQTHRATLFHSNTSPLSYHSDIANTLRLHHPSIIIRKLLWPVETSTVISNNVFPTGGYQLGLILVHVDSSRVPSLGTRKKVWISQYTTWQNQRKSLILFRNHPLSAMNRTFAKNWSKQVQQKW